MYECLLQIEPLVYNLIESSYSPSKRFLCARWCISYCYFI